MTSDSTEDTTTFADLGLRPELLGALSGLGYEEPTPIQREAIPPLLQGRDLLGQAATGTGKTAAFALPVLERIGRQAERGEPMALVLVPTRELAVQVSEAMHRHGRELGARILPIYGGQPIGRQLRGWNVGSMWWSRHRGGPSTTSPRQTLGLGSLEVVVLDEADEMLDMGFAEDIEAILRHTPCPRRLCAPHRPSRPGRG
jgi:ATP-dependent RNA helicase DeaD